MHSQVCGQSRPGGLDYHLKEGIVSVRVLITQKGRELAGKFNEA